MIECAAMFMVRANMECAGMFMVRANRMCSDVNGARE